MMQIGAYSVACALVLVVLGLASTAQAAPLKVCMVSGSFEYDSDACLDLLKDYLEEGYDVQVTLLKATSWTEILGLEALDDCDVALFFTRRLKVEGEPLDRIKAYWASGRPIVGVRTASHGFQNALEFDKEVLGGNYHNHYGKGLTTRVSFTEAGKSHPILDGVGELRSRNTLYMNKPIAEDTEILATGMTPESDGSEPVAWTRVHHGGRVFYTSLGGLGDFEGASFKRMLANALFWTAERDLARKPLPDVARRPVLEGTLHLKLRTRVHEDGAWTEKPLERDVSIAETAILICDMWDNHWCSFAAERCDAIAQRMNGIVEAARERGVQIIHAPSDTMGFYTDTPQRRRMQLAPMVEPPKSLDLPDRPLPITAPNGGCPGDDVQYSAWTRQSPHIEIGEYDGISDDGREVYSFMQQEGIKHLIIMGVHTNMCVLGRSFAIRQMTRWGVPCYLVRDLTDTMYDPKDPPNVTHDEGTELVVQHIEQHWCPSLLSEDLVAGLPE
ncbi:MAG TPA: isochorismatase family protein [Candidatus Hydrogenedentes bacterium]|nr:isochorismatase family protein [Candidatus Hydrogenedentota bacterium]HPG65717.1 isochorismatase family protein [Candidatus Hydrogenedentota bacterium]